MIQLNLLPDVKLEYIKAKRLKRTAMVLSVLVSGSALVLLVFTVLLVSVAQKTHLKNLDKDIKTGTNKLQSIDDLDKILTVQSQLNSLPDLHSQKPVNSRLFSYMEQITPANAAISSLTFDMDTQKLTISGKADNIVTVNKFVDTLKFTGYQIGSDSKTQKPAFSEIVLSSFSLGEKESSYSIDFKFDPLLFDAKADARLVVPKNKITTRSEVDKPLFQSNSSTGQ